MSEAGSAGGGRPDVSEVSGADPIVEAYARALLDVASAEDALDRLEEELFRFARSMQSSPELRNRLVDPAIDVATKLGIVGDLLGGRAHPQTLSAIGYIVQSGRTRQLPQIADALVARAARSRQHAFAEVRSAVPLDASQQRRLAEALARTVGHEVDMKVVVDENVVGGLVVKIGDTVMDGSVARRLATVRTQLTGAE